MTKALNKSWNPDEQYMYFRPWLNILIRMNRDYHNTRFQWRSRWAIRLYQLYCVLNLKPFLNKNNKNKNSTNSRYSIFSKDLGLSIISKKQETWSFYARSIKVGICAKSNKLGMHEKWVFPLLRNNRNNWRQYRQWAVDVRNFLINLDYLKFNSGQPNSTKVAKTVNWVDDGLYLLPMF